jgi:hypothetical protein
MWWIPIGFCILESKSFKVSCNGLGLEDFLTFSLSVNYLKDLRDFELDKGGVDPFSPKYRLSSIICDVASFRLFKPVRSEPLHDNNRKFLHIPFANKGIDAINISNILNRKEVVKEIPPFRPCTRDLIVLTQSDKDSNSGSWSTSLFIHLLA